MKKLENQCQNNMNDILKKWQERLKLNDWYIYLIRENKEIIKKNWKSGPNGDSFFNEKLKVGFIRLAEDNERTIVHELLHMANPNATEIEVEKLTIVEIKKTGGEK